jgi:hypothetical protein
LNYTKKKKKVAVFLGDIFIAKIRKPVAKWHKCGFEKDAFFTLS